MDAFVNLGDYVLKPGNWFLQAVTDAVNNHIPLFVPAGDWRIDAPGIEINGDLTIIGAGRTMTRITSPELYALGTTNYSCFNLSKSSRLHISELTIQGPLQLAVQSPVTWGISAIRNMDQDDTPTQLDLSDVTIAGHFNNAIELANKGIDTNTSPGCHLRIDRCDMEADYDVSAMYDSSMNTKSVFYARDTYFRRATNLGGPSTRPRP